jgi:hypothetical protein
MIFESAIAACAGRERDLTHGASRPTRRLADGSSRLVAGAEPGVARLGEIRAQCQKFLEGYKYPSCRASAREFTQKEREREGKGGSGTHGGCWS